MSSGYSYYQSSIVTRAERSLIVSRGCYLPTLGSSVPSPRDIYLLCFQVPPNAIRPFVHADDGAGYSPVVGTYNATFRR